mmetsp:Transcript_22471/g.72370  ORF Transcript_22471/g.72370 Transcript_22471/m.72370 type:complete len:232 (-) Transcript_22471:3387-4082(-)
MGRAALPAAPLGACRTPHCPPARAPAPQAGAASVSCGLHVDAFGSGAGPLDERPDSAFAPCSRGCALSHFASLRRLDVSALRSTRARFAALSVGGAYHRSSDMFAKRSLHEPRAARHSRPLSSRERLPSPRSVFLSARLSRMAGLVRLGARFTLTNESMYCAHAAPPSVFAASSSSSSSSSAAAVPSSSSPSSSASRSRKKESASSPPSAAYICSMLKASSPSRSARQLLR